MQQQCNLEAFSNPCCTLQPILSQCQISKSNKNTLQSTTDLAWKTNFARYNQAHYENNYFSITKGLIDRHLKFLSLYFLNKRHSNIKFTIEKQINHSIAFLDVFISDINNQNFTLQTYHKSTYAGLLLNFKSFTSFSFKISLIKCLIDRSSTVCDNWNSFHDDIESIKSNLIKNAYRPFSIDKVVKKYLNYRSLISKVN